MNADAIPFFIGGIALFLVLGWGVLSFCRTLHQSYQAIRQQKAIRTGEIVGRLARSNGMAWFALGLIHLFAAETITWGTAAASFLDAFLELSGILLLSVFCACQVYRYNRG